MSADKLHAIGDLPLQGFPRPGFDVLMAEQRFPLRPALNPLEQSTGPPSLILPCNKNPSFFIALVLHIQPFIAQQKGSPDDSAKTPQQ